MKALSIRQPYANWIKLEDKTIELRSWQTRHRGDLLIVASLGRADLDEEVTEFMEPWEWEPRGCAICVVELARIRRSRRRDASEACCYMESDDECFAWILKNPRTVRPVPIKSRLNLFEVPDARIRYL